VLAAPDKRTLQFVVSNAFFAAGFRTLLSGLVNTDHLIELTNISGYGTLRHPHLLGSQVVNSVQPVGARL
jgi:hypothetical protein